MSQEPILTVKCFTYNQEAYIRQTLEGFVMQKTSFRFEVIVHDDASQDGTPDIVREYAAKYPELIKPILQKENLLSKGDGSLGRAVEAAMSPSSRYVAFCEGDDYWIDPFKLQKQVDFLEVNPDYILTYTDYNQWNQDEQRMEEALLSTGKKERIHSYEEHLLKFGFITPCSWVGRRELFAYYEPFGGKWVDSSYAIALEAFATSKIKFINEVCVVYRSLSESGSHSLDLFKTYTRMKGIFAIQKEYMQKYPVSEEWRRKVIHSMFKNVFVAQLYGFLDWELLQEMLEFYGTQPSRREIRLKRFVMKHLPEGRFRRTMERYVFRLYLRHCPVHERFIRGISHIRLFGLIPLLRFVSQGACESPQCRRAVYLFNFLPLYKENVYTIPHSLNRAS